MFVADLITNVQIDIWNLNITFRHCKKVRLNKGVIMSSHFVDI